MCRICGLAWAISLLALATMCPAAPDPWDGSFYPYRVPITLEIPEAGQYRLDLSPETITAWINEKADFRFDPKYFSYDGIKLVEIDSQGQTVPRGVDAAYQIAVGRELVVNGSFERHETGRPVGWQIDHADFHLQKASFDGSWCMTANGADRHGCVQSIATDPGAWYRFSCRAKGPAAVGPHDWPKGQWWSAMPHTYADPYIPAEGWYKIEYYFHTMDKTDSQNPQVQVRMERYTGSVDDISVRQCQVALVLRADRPGTRRFWLYSSPSEGITPEVPSKSVATLPSRILPVQKTGQAEYLDTDLRYSIGSSPMCDLWYSSPLRKTFEHESPPVAARKAIRFSAARNESEAVQLVLRPRTDGDIRAVRAWLSGTHRYQFPESSFDIRQAKYVAIREPSKTGAGYQQASRSGFTGRLPDPLPRFTPVAVTAGGPNLILWVDVKVPKDAPAGLSSGEITIATSAGTIRVPWELQVWDFTLPDRPTCRTAFQFARYANNYLFPFHKVGTDPQDRYALSRAYVAELARYKITARSPQAAGFWDPAKDSLGPLGTDQKELAWALDELHVTGFGIGHHSGPLLGGETVESATSTARQYEPIAAMLQKKHWLKDAYIQIDEPQPPHYPGLRNWIEAFRRQPHAKNIAMFAFVYDGQSYDLLRDSVDILVPENNDGGSTVSPTAIARWPKAKEVWCYWTNTAHQWIDAPNIDARLWAPKVWWMGARGMATWAIAIWWKESQSLELANPWVDPSSPWGNGVMAYFYPPSPKGVDLPARDLSIVPSLRLALTRDGIEDYEYAVLLERLLAERSPTEPDAAEGFAALASLRRQFRTPTAWTLGEVHWQQARDATARAIQKLSKKGENK